MFLPLLTPSSDYLMLGTLTRGYAFTVGVNEAWGFDAGPYVAGASIGSATGKTALDGSGFELAAIVTTYASSVWSTYIWIDGCDEFTTGDSVWTTFTHNGVTLTATSAAGFAYAGSGLCYWYYTGTDPLGLYALRQASDVTVYPFTIKKA
jgi:hypothetical protein